MSYSVSDFDGMELNPFKVPKGEFIFDYYQILKASRVFGKIPDPEEREAARDFVTYKSWSQKQLDLLLRFIVLQIDPESPLFEITDLEKKKESAKTLLQKKYPEDKWSKVWVEIDEELELYNQKLYEFFVIVNDHDYEHWYSLKIQLHRFNAELRGNFREDKDGSIEKNLNSRRYISKEIKNLKNELDSVEIRLFPDNKRLAKKIATLSMAEAIGGFAEKYALIGPWTT